MKWVRLISVILVLSIAASGLLAGSVHLQAQSPSSLESTFPTVIPTTVPSDPPSTSEPLVSEPPVTQVPETQSPTADPTITEPSVTEPSVTEPPVAEPPVTKPTVTDPPVTQPPVTQPPETQPEDVLAAANAFIYDCTENTYLFTKGDLTAKLYPASITKLFTVWIVLQHLDMEQSVTAGDILDTVPDDSSEIYLEKGETLTVRQLLYGTLLCSGGDAARVLAAEAGRAIAQDPDMTDADAMTVFIGEMNTQAAAQGMTGSHFVTADGYHDDEHYSCMADLLIVGKLCLTQPQIMEIVKTVSIENPLARKKPLWTNTNMLLNPESPFYRPNAAGMKTGYTSKAGRCLLSAFLEDDRVILIGTFGCPDPNFTYIPHFQDTCYLYDTYIANANQGA